MSKNMLTIEEISFKNNCGIAPDIIADIVKRARQGMIQKVDEAGYIDWWKTHMYPQSDGDYRELWGCAQAALLAAPLVIDLRGVVWPEWAVEMLFSFIGVGGKNQACNHIPRPTPAWRPKEGDRVWAVYDNCNAIHIVKDNWRPQICTKYAAARNLDELDWTWEQFKARGDTWEVE